MRTDYLRAAVILAWILATGGLAYLAGTTSLAGWAVVAVLSLVPPAVTVWFWSVPSPSMSETIQKVLR
jgi:hypothetical protein